MIVGVGSDIVDVASFADQLNEPGSRFAHVFTGRELRRSQARASSHTRAGEEPDAAPHLAARWAAKEAFIKAWSGALYGEPPIVREADVVWAEIEVVQDPWGRPSLALHGAIAHAVKHTVGEVSYHLSLSHDGPVASAVVVMETRE